MSITSFINEKVNSNGLVLLDCRKVMRDYLDGLMKGHKERVLEVLLENLG